MLFLAFELFATEKSKLCEHLDFVLLENNCNGEIDSLFIYNSHNKTQIKIHEFKKKVGGIDLNMEDFEKIAKSDSIIIYLRVHDESFYSRSVPIGLKSDMLKNCIINFKGWETHVGRGKKKRYYFNVELSYQQGAYSFGKILQIEE